jgi:hypothetical protein
MKTEKLGQSPAYPAFEHNESGYGDQLTFYFGGERQYTPFTKGMSQRLLIAKDAMCAMLSNQNTHYQGTIIDHHWICAKALEIADELLKQEAE